MKTYMKKVWILLLICLTMMSPIYSQTPSNDCIVPCSTLRAAMKVKYDLDLAYNKIYLLRDSVSIMDSIIYRKDTIITNKNTIIANLNSSLDAQKKISKENKDRGDFYKKEVDSQKFYKWVAIVAGSISTLASLIFF